MRAFHVHGLFLAAGSLGLTAAEPVFTHAYPPALQAGTSGLVSFNGTFDPWPCQVHAAVPGLKFEPRKEAGDFEVTVAADMPLGPCLLRAFNAEGASAPVALMITDRPQTAEVEPNDDFRAPQVTASGTVVVNGRLDKSEDVDSYQLSLTKGRTLVAWVEAHVLAAGCDTMLRVTDARGLTLAFNHDGPSTMDPLLVFTAPEDGIYTVQIMGHKYPAASEVRFAGGKDCIYRLHLSTGPVVRNLWPPVRPKEGMVSVEGWNLPANRIAHRPDTTILFPPRPSWPVELTSTGGGLVLTPPCAVSGRITMAGADDRYPFKAAQGEHFELVVSGPVLGSEMDPWVKVLDTAGKELAVNDDSDGSSDARLAWTAPAEGTYTAVVGDLTRRGGPDFYYRLALTHPVPGVSATAEAHAIKVEAGKTAEIKVKVVFSHGFATPLTLAARSLPGGVSAAAVTVPAKGGEVTLKLTAESSASTASLPIQLVLAAPEAGAEYPIQFRMVSATENNGVPQGYRQLLIPETTDLWLTVTAPPPEPKEPPPAETAKP